MEGECCPIDLLLIAFSILICVFFNKISSKLGIPMLLVFIAFGMLFGSDGLLKVSFDSFDFARDICSVALIFIMFYGGFGTNWNEAKPIATKAVLLSTLGVFITAGLVGLFCHLVLRIELLESFLIGSVVSSTDAASVFSLLRSKRLNLKDNTASILEVESGSNDPAAYMLTIIVLSIMSGNTSSGQILYVVFAQIVYGVAFGVAIAFSSLYILKRVRFSTVGFDAAFVVAIALLAYAAPTAVGGNGYLSAYFVGIVLGNNRILNKRALVHFFDGVTGLMQMLIFFLLGLLSFPSKMPAILLPAILIALFLTFVARPAVVFSILSPFRCSTRQKLLVSWAGLRGAASIVFAIIAMLNPAAMQNDVFHIVFCVVLFSIALQGSLLPHLSKKLNMIDESENVLRTFSDYSEEIPVQYIKLTISNKHPWNNLHVRELPLPPDTLLVLILRGSNQIVPKGKSVILENDRLIISAPALEDRIPICLSELKIEKNSHFRDKRIADLKRKPDHLIMLIKRQGRVIIPSGKTILRENDVLVINCEDS